MWKTETNFSCGLLLSFPDKPSLLNWSGTLIQKILTDLNSVATSIFNMSQSLFDSSVDILWEMLRNGEEFVRFNSLLWWRNFAWQFVLSLLLSPKLLLNCKIYLQISTSDCRYKGWEWRNEPNCVIKCYHDSRLMLPDHFFKAFSGKIFIIFTSDNFLLVAVRLFITFKKVLLACRDR